jgi:hypothetical protein
MTKVRMNVTTRGLIILEKCVKFYFIIYNEFNDHLVDVEYPPTNFISFLHLLCPSGPP